MTQKIKQGLRLGAAVGLAFASLGCANRELGPVEPVVQSGTSIVITQAESDAVDLLVMVDNSNSMAQEQANLAENFPILITALTQPEDSDGDGQTDYPAVSDLHIGVVSTDMGTGGYAVTTCEDAVDGDDGILQNTPSELVDPELCENSYPSYLSWGEEDDPVALSNSFSCIAVLGTGGCGFEQQLKSVRKALKDHAAGANAGFLRDDSLLAILMVTDEEDCSVREDVRNATDIFNTQLQLGPLNLRCYAHREQYVAPVDEFVDAILGLRPDNPERLVVAGIVGIPPDTSCNLVNMTDSDFQCLLDEPKMQEVVDNSADGQGERLTPSCDVPGLGEAFPPRRIVDFIKQINHEGNNGIVRSICERDFRPAMEAITSLIQSKVLGACLARPLNPNASNQVRCIIQETLMTSDDCPAGRIDLGVAGEQRRCQICQKGDGEGDRLFDELGQSLEECGRFNASGDYWEYEPADQSTDCPATGKVVFQRGAVPLDGSVVHLECLSKVGEE